LDALQAAILRVKLKHLAQWTDARRRHAALYRELVGQAGLGQEVRPPIELQEYFHVYNQFTIRVPDRDELREFLKRNGIPTEIYYPVPLHVQPAFEYLGYRPGDFPQSEAASREVLALPIYPELTDEQQRMVVAIIAEFYEQRSEAASPQSAAILQ
jgi:dTDP-4-amino-4,6-dideoxygalactose transaminase